MELLDNDNVPDLSATYVNESRCENAGARLACLRRAATNTGKTGENLHSSGEEGVPTEQRFIITAGRLLGSYCKSVAVSKKTS